MALLAAALAGVVYWLTLPPTVTGEDSGELITAAWSLGIPHPYGYPLWALLAHLFTWIPLYSVAWRVSLASAVFALAAVLLLVRLLQFLLRDPMAAFAGGLVLAFSREFWEQAVIAEVYTLSACFLLICVTLLRYWQFHPKNRTLFIFAFLYGLGLGAHYTIAAAGPIFAIFILIQDRFSWRRWSVYLRLLGLAFLGGLIFLYLPIRSHADPVMDWGNPERWENFLGLLTRKQYAFMFTQYPRSVLRFAGQVWALSKLWVWEFTPWVGFMGLAGLGVALWRDFRFTLFLVALGLWITLSAAYTQNFNLDKEWLWIMSVFPIPAYMVTAYGVGVALDYSHARWGRVASSVLLIVCVASPLLVWWEENDKSDFYWTEDYARNVLESLAPEAVYVPDADHASFTATYLQAVEGLRPDVTILRKCGYLDMEALPEIPAALREEYGEFPPRRYEPALFVWLIEHTDYPFYFQKKPLLPVDSGIRLQQAGLTWRALRPGEAVDTKDYWAGYRWHTLDHADCHGDYTAELILYELTMAKAMGAFSAGETQRGKRLVKKAVEYYGPDPNIYNNAGVVCARYQQYETARQFFAYVVLHHPDIESARKNLARVERILGERAG